MILEAGGSEPEEARIVADHLVLANLSGHDSHGVGMLPAYERSLGNETLPEAEPDRRTGPATTARDHDVRRPAWATAR